MRARVDPDHDVLHHRERREQREVLEGPPDAQRGHAVGAEAEDRPAREQDRALVGCVELAHAVEERGLPRAVRTDEADDLTIADVEGDVIQRDDAAETHRDVTNGQQGRLGGGAGHGENGFL